MGRSEAGPSLDGMFCGSCGIYNDDGSRCRACGASLASETSGAPRLGFEEPPSDVFSSWDLRSGPDDPSDGSPGAAALDCPDCGFPRVSASAGCSRCGRSGTFEVWRHGSWVIARKGAEFTHACVRCGSTDDLRVAVGRALGGMNLSGGRITGVAGLAGALRQAFASDAYEIRLALCPKHDGLIRWIESRSRTVSVIAVASMMQAAPGSGDYRRYKGMAKGFRETLPEWVGPFPPNAG